MVKPALPEEKPPALSDVLNALRDPTRRLILLRLQEGERHCSTLRDLGSKTALSYHFAILRQAGLTQSKKDGTFMYLSLAPGLVEQTFPGLLQAVLDGERREQTRQGPGPNLPSG